MPAYAVSALKDTKIKRMTKGIVAYECLMLSNINTYEDELNQLIVSRLSDLPTGRSLRAKDEFKKIILENYDTARSILHDRCEYEDPTSSLTRVNLHLPVTLVEQLPDGRGLGGHISEAIVYTVASPWMSRMDMLQDIDTLVRVSEGAVIDDMSPFVDSVVTGKNDTYDVSKLHALVMGRSADADYLQMDDDVSLATDDINPMAMPQTYQYRAPYLMAAVRNQFENVETVTRSIIEMMSRQVWEAADSTHDRIVDEVVRHLRQSDEYVTSLLMLADSKDMVPESYKHLVKERYGLASDTTMWEYELSSVIEELDYIDSEINSSTAKMKYSPMEMSQMQSDYSAMQETASWIESQISAE